MIAAVRALVILLFSSLAVQALPAGMTDQTTGGGLGITYVETPSMISGQTNIFVTLTNTSGTASGYNLFLSDRVNVTSGNNYILTLMTSHVSSGSNFTIGYHLYNSSDAYVGENDTNFLTVEHGFSNSMPLADIALGNLVHKYTVAAGVGKIQPRIGISGIPTGTTMSFNLVAFKSDAAGSTSGVASCGPYGPKVTSPPAGAIIVNPGDAVASIVAGAATGATIFFNAGTYRVGSIVPKNNQTLIGAQGAILNGSNVLGAFTSASPNFFIGGQTQEGVRNTGAVCDAASPRCQYPETVYIDNVPLKPKDAIATLASGFFYFDYSLDRIYIRDNPSGKTVEAGVHDHAFEGSATGVTIKNFIVEKYANPVQDGAIQGRVGWIVQDNEIRLNKAVGMYVEENGQMIGNYVHDNGQMGYGGYGHGTGGILIQGNHLAYNGHWSGVDENWEAGGGKIAVTTGSNIRNNYSHNNKGHGLWTDIDNVNSLYEDNTVVDNSGGGISHEISYAAIIRNNVLYRNGPAQGWFFGGAIQIQNSTNVEAYGNRIEAFGSASGQGILLIQQNRGSGIYGTWNVTANNNVHNNIIVARDPAPNVGGVCDFNCSTIFPGGNAWANNQYFMADGSRFHWNSTAMNFASFKTATGENGTISTTYPDTSTWVCP